MSETREVIEVEQVVIGPDGYAYRNESAKRRLAYQKAAGNKVFSRLGIALKSPEKQVEPTPET